MNTLNRRTCSGKWRRNEQYVNEGGPPSRGLILGEQTAEVELTRGVQLRGVPLVVVFLQGELETLATIFCSQVAGTTSMQETRG
jgi:hypothetical protein